MNCKGFASWRLYSAARQACAGLRPPHLRPPCAHPPPCSPCSPERHQPAAVADHQHLLLVSAASRHKLLSLRRQSVWYLACAHTCRLPLRPAHTRAARALTPPLTCARMARLLPPAATRRSSCVSSSPTPAMRSTRSGARHYQFALRPEIGLRAVGSAGARPGAWRQVPAVPGQAHEAWCGDHTGALAD